MDDFKQIKNIYFLGIGGIGMSGLARYFAGKGFRVAGYDRQRSAITDALERIGVEVTVESSAEAIPGPMKNPSDTLVVFTPAIPVENPQFVFFRNGGFRVKKRSEVLGMVTRESFCIAVGGTHGKTTCSAMIAFLLREAGIDLSAFVGGVMENYGTNFVEGEEAVTVVEADEFDRSFLQLSPDIACITSIDADHLDIYGSRENVEEAFREFAARLKKGGRLFTCAGVPVEGIRYGLEGKENAYNAVGVRVEGGFFVFDVEIRRESGLQVVEGVKIRLPGLHNVQNATLSLAVADAMGVPMDKAKAILERFKGTKRRFNTVVSRPDFVLIDDYAHHPAEIQATVSAARMLYPERKITGLFQPHLFSRTRDLADDFARALSGLDRVVLLDIYPAREEPIEGVTSQWLASKIEGTPVRVVAKDALTDCLDKERPEVLLMMGAGDIADWVEPVGRLSEKW